MKVDYERKKGTLSISFIGELDHSSAKMAMQSIENLLYLYDDKEIYLNLERLSFADSSAIAVVLFLSKNAKTRNRTLRIVNTPKQAMRVFQAAKLDKVVNFMCEVNI